MEFAIYMTLPVQGRFVRTAVFFAASTAIVQDSEIPNSVCFPATVPDSASACKRQRLSQRTVLSIGFSRDGLAAVSLRSSPHGAERAPEQDRPATERSARLAFHPAGRDRAIVAGRRRRKGHLSPTRLGRPFHCRESPWLACGRVHDRGKYQHSANCLRARADPV